jgi:hypothetical protein
MAKKPIRYVRRRPSDVVNHLDSSILAIEKLREQLKDSDIEIISFETADCSYAVKNVARMYMAIRVEIPIHNPPMRKRRKD